MRFVFLATLISLSVWGQEVTPTQRTYQSLNFQDDLDFLHLPKAVDRQLANYARRGLSGTIKFGTKVYPRTVLKDSLVLLKELALEAQACLKDHERQVCEDEFSRQINEKFAIYTPVLKSTERGYAQKKTYFTSYYTPDFRGSKVETAEYKNPIYALPQTTEDRTLSRVEIDLDQKLKGKNLEFMWVKETLFDIYFMHIQGGGRVVLPDGSVTYLSYAGANGKKFRFISEYLISQGLMQRGTINYFNQREFLEENPQHQRGAYETAPFFIYFKETSEEPHGLDNISLTEGRSLAWDNTVYKTLGVINFVKTVKTVQYDQNGQPQKVPFSRFFIAQDTGSAIRGNARCDLYWGYGEEALKVAAKLVELGDQYFLIKK